ncbi:hypothetical protein [uncultured Nocardioides sp.]|uniref:hypothetical protein n=1 Tax=uncultured Nocardioides sp. TaxID=198441 RepID=UPI002632C8A2|nr:hypothetical protein [uncultured Nocardioides sp.]
MYADHRPCSVCGAEVRLEAHPGAVTEPDGPVGPQDGVVGTADDGPDVRVCTNAGCPSRSAEG